MLDDGVFDQVDFLQVAGWRGEGEEGVDCGFCFGGFAELGLELGFGGEEVDVFRGAFEELVASGDALFGLVAVFVVGWVFGHFYFLSMSDRVRGCLVSFARRCRPERMF